MPGLLLASAVVNSKSGLLQQLVTSAAAVLANFGGIPLAFLFIATLDANAGIAHHVPAGPPRLLAVEDDLHLQLSQPVRALRWSTSTSCPAHGAGDDAGARGAQTAVGRGGREPRRQPLALLALVAGPVLLPNFLGSVLLLFCSSFSAFATAYAINSSFPIVTIRIQAVLSGNVLAGQENLGAALALDMIVIVLPLTIIYQLLQRRTSRWLA